MDVSGLVPKSILDQIKVLVFAVVLHSSYGSCLGGRLVGQLHDGKQHTERKEVQVSFF